MRGFLTRWRLSVGCFDSVPVVLIPPSWTGRQSFPCRTGPTQVPLSRLRLCPATSQPVRKVEILTHALPTISRGKDPFPVFPSVNAEEIYGFSKNASVGENLKSCRTSSVPEARARTRPTNPQ